MGPVPLCVVSKQPVLFNQTAVVWVFHSNVHVMDTATVLVPEYPWRIVSVADGPLVGAERCLLVFFTPGIQHFLPRNIYNL